MDKVHSRQSLTHSLFEPRKPENACYVGDAAGTLDAQFLVNALMPAQQAEKTVGHENYSSFRWILIGEHKHTGDAE